MSDVERCGNCKHSRPARPNPKNVAGALDCYCPCYADRGHSDPSRVATTTCCCYADCDAEEAGNPEVGFTLSIDKVLLTMAKEGT